MNKAQDFAETLKNNPKKIIEWAKREIKEYENLIKILEAPTSPKKASNRRLDYKKV